MTERLFDGGSAPGTVPLALCVAREEARPRSSTLAGALEHAASNGWWSWYLDGQNATKVPWSEVIERASGLARELLRRGLRRRDRAVLLLPTGPDFPVAWFGTVLAGGIPVPASLGLGPGGADSQVPHVAHILRDSEARFIVSGPRARTAVARLAEHGIDRVDHVRIEDVTTPGPAGAPPLPSVSPEDTAMLQYTSGSTSLPKGVELTHSAILSNVYGVGERTHMNPDDVGVSWLPLFHDMGLIGALFTSLYWGYPLCMFRPESFLLHPKRWLQAVARFGATLSVAPNFAYGLAAFRIRDQDIADLRLDSWRCALNGAEPVDVGTIERFVGRFGPAGFRRQSMFPCYGLAENCLAAAFPKPETDFDFEKVDRALLEESGIAAPARDGQLVRVIVSVGSPIAGQRVGISDGAGGYLPERRVGEVLVGGACLMKGYFRQEEETARVLDDGWLHTGDLGFVADGRLFLTGRSKEIIIKRGRNLYPQDLERIAEEASGAGPNSSAAFGTTGDDSGTEEIVLVVESKLRNADERDELARRIQAELLSALSVAADRIVVVPRGALPRTTSGKLRRLECRARWGAQE